MKLLALLKEIQIKKPATPAEVYQLWLDLPYDKVIDKNFKNSKFGELVWNEEDENDIIHHLETISQLELQQYYKELKQLLNQ